MSTRNRSVGRPSLLPGSLLVALASCSGGSGSSEVPSSARCTVTPSAAWAGAVDLPDDPFVSRAAGTAEEPLPSWVKFTVLGCDPETVYFQDSRSQPFHYEFGVEALDPFLGLSRAEYDAVTLFEQGRQAILGAVLVPPLAFRRTGVEEYGVQLVGKDPLPGEEVVDIVRRVSERIGAEPGATVYYFPTFEQQAAATRDEALLADAGILLSSTARWASFDSVYSTGWAIGTLKYVPAAELEDAFARGDLEGPDVLLTDGVPASVPLVAGILSLSPSSSASHVAILSQNFGLPFGFLAEDAERQRVRSLVGRRVAVRAYHEFSGSRLEVFDVEDAVDDATLRELLTLKQPEPLQLRPVAPLGELARPVAEVQLSDVPYVGGKSVGLGVLTRAIPESVPAALAFSFDLWNGFLDQPVQGGDTPLREVVAALLGGHTYPPADLELLRAELRTVRDLVEDPASTTFAPGQEQAVLEALLDPSHGFQPGARIRFRSSSNMEDAERFTGAGLYSSHSGCLEDDLDGDEVGPSHCDPEHPKERGVLRAIRKVFSSFYDERPFLARLRYGVDESEVGMAVLAHHSFPDELELANGVARLDRKGPFSFDVTFLTQIGASSVTNPEPGVVPEKVLGLRTFSGAIALTFVEPSNLVPLGAGVLDLQADYTPLVELLGKAATTFAREAGRAQFLLEFEFKKLAPGGAALPEGGLVVKQMRELPQADNTPSVTPFVIASTASHTTFQGEKSNVVSNHRLKVELDLTTRSGWLDELVAAGELWTAGSLRFNDGCEVREQPFVVPSDGRTSQRWDGEAFELTLEQPDLWNPRISRIRTAPVRLQVAPSFPPILFASDLRGLTLDVDHADPVAIWQDFPTRGLTMAVHEQVTLTGPREPRPSDIFLSLQAEGAGALVDIDLYWPRGPAASAGYTAPLAAWGGTVVSGLTSEPLVLRGEYSQTYRPQHHNFGGRFLFQPSLEPGISPLLLEELTVQGIDAILVEHGLGAPTGSVRLLGAVELGHSCARGR